MAPREAQPWVIHLAAGSAQRASGYAAGQPFLEALIEYFRRLQWAPAVGGVAEGTWLELVVDFEAATGFDVLGLAPQTSRRAGVIRPRTE